MNFDCTLRRLCSCVTEDHKRACSHFIHQNSSMRKNASSIHFGKDEEGFYFSFVDRTTNTYHSVNLNRMQAVLLVKQGIENLLPAKLGAEACDG